MICSISCGEWSHLISGILIERASVVWFEEEVMFADVLFADVLFADVLLADV